MVGATAAPNHPFTRAGGQDDGSLHKLPQLILIGFDMILMGFNLILNVGLKPIPDQPQSGCYAMGSGPKARKPHCPSATLLSVLEQLESRRYKNT